MSLIRGIQHVAIDVVSPTRQVEMLRSFGLDALYTFQRRGRYITSVGDPTAPRAEDGRQRNLLPLFFVPGLPRGRLNHICFDVEDVGEAIRAIKKSGVKVDEEDADRIYGPEGLIFQVDSTSKPRREFLPGSPKRTAHTPIAEYERTATGKVARDDLGETTPYSRTPPANAGMVKGIEHVAIDVKSPTRLADFLKRAFGLVPLQIIERRGRYITSFGNPELPPDELGRRRGILPAFFMQGVPEGQLNHVAFEVDDATDAVRRLQAEGVEVDEEDADRIYGPERIMYQVDSRTKPRPEFYPGAKKRPAYTPLDAYDPGVDTSEASGD